MPASAFACGFIGRAVGGAGIRGALLAAALAEAPPRVAILSALANLPATATPPALPAPIAFGPLDAWAGRGGCGRFSDCCGCGEAGVASVAAVGGGGGSYLMAGALALCGSRSRIRSPTAISTTSAAAVSAPQCTTGERHQERPAPAGARGTTAAATCTSCWTSGVESATIPRQWAQRDRWSSTGARSCSVSACSAKAESRFASGCWVAPG